MELVLLILSQLSAFVVAREDTLQDSPVNCAQIFLVIDCLAKLVDSQELQQPLLELFNFGQAHLASAVLREKVLEIGVTQVTLACRRLRLEHIALLKLEEDQLVLVEERLSHLPIPFDEVQQVHDVQVSLQLLLTLMKVELFPFATVLKTLIAS